MTRLAITVAAVTLAACGTAPADTTVHAGPTATTPVRAHVAEAADATMGLDLVIAARYFPPRAARSGRRAKVRATPRAVAPSAPRGGDVWDALARCESGGNPRATSSSGAYLGAFQFSLSTWRSVGESGDPRDHSYEHQRAAAQRLQARSGFGQWPACSRRIGVR